MVPLAECRLRPLPRTLSILAALLGAGLLASACSEAPKLAKAPTSYPTTSEEKASPPPEAPEANKSDEDARRKAAEAEEAERVRELSRQGSAAKQKHSRRYEPEPAQAHPRREQVRSRAYPTPTSPPTMLRERPEVVHPKYRPMSCAQPAKVLRRCNPKCHREARHRRAT